MPVDEQIARLTRGQQALMAINTRVNPYGPLEHVCADYTENSEDGCQVCWQVAVDVDRALRGTTVCGRCRGTGMPGPEGDACDECGGGGEFDPADDPSPASRENGEIDV